MRAFLRIILVIPVGFMAAIAAAVAVYLGALGFRPADLSPDGDGLPQIAGPVAILLVVIARYAALPFLAAIVVAEWLSLRRMLVWCGLGGTIGAAIPLFAGNGQAEVTPALAAGLMAGFAYWLVAGRGSGPAPILPVVREDEADGKRADHRRE